MLHRTIDLLESFTKCGEETPICMEIRTRQVVNSNGVLTPEYIGLKQHTYSYQINGKPTHEMKKYFMSESEKLHKTNNRFEIRKEGMEISYILPTDNLAPICVTYKFFNIQDFDAVVSGIIGS